MQKKILFIIFSLLILSGNTLAAEFNSGKCSIHLELTENLKSPTSSEKYIQNGFFHWYTNKKVSQAHILQKHLNRLGFNAGVADGIIGPNTKGAILRMQKYLGTIQDGYVGPKTRALLNNSCGENNSTASEEIEEEKISLDDLDSILTKGLNDSQTFSAVSKMQKYLKENNYSIIVDGDFGPGTENIVKKFTLDKFKKKLNYFDPRMLETYKNKTEKNYNPKKIKSFLGYGKFDFFYLDFPFSENKIESLSCGGIEKDYIFEKGKIMFPLSKQTEGKFICRLNTKLDGEEKTFEIAEVYFTSVKRATTKVNLTKKYSTGPTTELQKRIAGENVMLKKMYSEADRERKFTGHFEVPMKTKRLSEFGKVRIFNDGRRSVHSGTDYKAQTPLPIYSINDGEIIMAGVDLYYCGKGVIVNHGMNLFSTYCHLSENKVSIGDKVSKGDLLGLTGATGRVSGPHLHLSVKYNGGYIDFEELQKKSEIAFK